METLRVADIGQLRDYLAGLDKKVLFRGQTRHYESDGKPSATTSFDRHGCIPREMLRWSRYADDVLLPFTGQRSDLALNQAILQHYGFRSFYLDCSANPAVSAWFASHRYSEQGIFELSEDCDEAPLFLRKKRAGYDPSEGTGNLYILDRVACEQVGLTDLTALSSAGARTRPGTQSAYLLGPLRNQSLPAECFLAHIEADCEVFGQLAEEEGFATTGDVFPPSSADPILETLLSLPWNSVPGVQKKEGEIPFFRRAIELPEYDDSFVKIASPTVAFYGGGRIADVVDTVDGFRGGPVIMVPEIVLFGSPGLDAELRFPNIVGLIEDHKGVLFEAPALLKFPGLGGGTTYQKGLALDLIEPRLVHLGALMVMHPGQRISAAGIARGRFYRIDEEGRWRQEAREGECPCGDDNNHLRDLRALHIVEAFLGKPSEFADM